MPPFTDGNFEETKWYPLRTKAICSLLTSQENASSATGKCKIVPGIAFQGIRAQSRLVSGVRAEVREL